MKTSHERLAAALRF